MLSSQYKYSRVLAQCRQVLRTAFQQSHGHEVDSQGDAFFFAFARATDAVSAVVACAGYVDHPFQKERSKWRDPFLFFAILASDRR
jgi:class 3 adenylate cyclase